MKVKHVILNPETNDMRKIRKDFLKSDADVLFLQAEYVILPEGAIEKLARQIQGAIQCISGWVPVSKLHSLDIKQPWNALKLVADHTIAHTSWSKGVTRVDYVSPECCMISRKLVKEIPFNFKERKELTWVTGFKIITNSFMNFCNDIYEAGYAIHMHGDVVCNKKPIPEPKDVDDPFIEKGNDKVIVMFTIDDNYVIPLAVAIKTLIDHFSEDRELKIIVGDVGISQENKNKLSGIYPLEFVKVDVTKVKKIKINIVYHTSAIFARLILVEMLDVDKVLYLDPDIIIQEDISRLWDMDVSNHVLAAAQDDTIQEKDGYIYFNSGVMLINLRKWKERKVSKKAIKYVSKNITNHTDQDAVNHILKGDYLRISKRWNANPTWGERKGLRIVHFLGSEKPWWFKSTMEIVPEYYRLIDMTPFQGWRPGIPQEKITII